VPRRFTTCGATGANPPDPQACISAYAGTALASEARTDSSQAWGPPYGDTRRQVWIVPATGSYRITAYGASGGTAHPIFMGGPGAMAQGTFSLSAGDNIWITVGQRGQAQAGGGPRAAGGGGGTFVWRGGSAAVSSRRGAARRGDIRSSGLSLGVAVDAALC
jgi:hypothetical protein